MTLPCHMNPSQVVFFCTAISVVAVGFSFGTKKEPLQEKVNMDY